MEKVEGLKSLGPDNLGRVYWNLPTPALYETAKRLRRPKDSVATTRLTTL
jgi:hypothetical protein